ncbi:hypothetical protein ABZ949_02490 [Micromonospora tulbaghiae]|uniref:hypothetical protein n=1 Tax=Micromonospora tulbaghiae TaxID=479978 RepID=UPI0033E23707
MTAGDVIAWRCSRCGGSADGGVLHISHRDVRAAERAAKEWNATTQSKEAFDLADIFMMPALAQWQVACPACMRAHNCAGCYQIELGQCATLTALLRWQAHLYDKSWFGATNWVGFVHRVAQEHAPHETAGVW